MWYPCGMEAILFVGPPCCGQEAYYYQHYANVVRYCEAAVFKSDQSFHLHRKIVDLIKQHGKVVIDNDHLDTEMRMAVLSGIKGQLPDCSVNSIDFIPRHDPIQCLWSLNWLLARNFIAKENDEIPNDYNLPISKQITQITSYSPSRIVLSLQLEKFDSVVHQESPLICYTHYKLTSPVLLLEWQGIQYQQSRASTSSDNSTQQQHILRARMKKMCQLWRDFNRTGHVIVLCENTPPSDSDAILATLSQLAQDLSSPIHCVMIPETISLEKNPFPWIQYLFRINFHHRASVLVFQTKHHQSIGKEIGIRTLTVFQVTDKPSLVVSKHSSEMQVPLLLHSMVYALPQPPYSSRHTALPLFSQAKRFHETGESKSSATSYVFADVYVAITKLRLVMLYHDYSVLKIHEENCRQALVPVSEPCAVDYNTITSTSVYSPKRLEERRKTPFFSLGNPVSVPVDYSDLPPPTAIPIHPVPTSTVTNTKRRRTLPLWLTEQCEKKRKDSALSTRSSSKTPRRVKAKPIQKSTLPLPEVASLDDLFNVDF